MSVTAERTDPVLGARPEPWPPFAVLDVETTGLVPGWHRIIQIGVATADEAGNVTHTWSTLVDPLRRRVGASKVHGIRRADLQGAPTFAEVASELAAQLDGKVLVTHNVTFDWGFLSRELRDAGLVEPDARRLCTLTLARQPDAGDGSALASRRLGALVEHFDVPLPRPHDALDDAVATAALLPHLLARAGVSTPGHLDVFVSGSSTSWALQAASMSWWGRIVRRAGDYVRAVRFVAGRVRFRRRGRWCPGRTFART